MQLTYLAQLLFAACALAAPAPQGSGRPNGWLSDMPNGGFPTGGFPTGGFPTGGFPTGGFPTGGFPTGGFPTGPFPTGGFPTGGLPTGGFPTGLPFGRPSVRPTGTNPGGPEQSA